VGVFYFFSFAMMYFKYEANIGADGDSRKA